MAVHSYNDLRSHVGHNLACVTYGGDVNVAVECEDCSVVLLDFDKDAGIASNQSKHVGEDGKLRYVADGSEVFPGPTGVRPDPRRWHVTVQVARVVEITYAVEAPDSEEAENAIHEPDSAELTEVERRTVNSNWEIIATVDVTDGRNLTIPGESPDPDWMNP